MRPRERFTAARTRVRNLVRDAAANRRCAGTAERILVARHPSVTINAYERGFLTWVGDNLPEARPHFELRVLPYRVRAGSSYRLHVPWLQDPVQIWSQRAYRQANELAADCDHLGIPVLNRVDRLTNAVKSEGARRIGDAGLRTPVVIPIEDIAAFKADGPGLEFPFIVREDWGHGFEAHLVADERELRDLELESMERPIAVEFVDVRTQRDGLFRKYRYVVAGNTGVPLSMHISESWCTRGGSHLMRHHLAEEEHAFASRAEEHAAGFLRAREALGLEFVAFDYAIDREGQPVVWEANPYPYIQLSSGRGAFRAPAVVRVFAALARLYLSAAGLPIPEKVDYLLAHPAVYSGQPQAQ